MDKERKEIRFLIAKKIYDKLQLRAKELDIPLASYVKANIKKWVENVL